MHHDHDDDHDDEEENDHEYDDIDDDMMVNETMLMKRMTVGDKFETH